MTLKRLSPARPAGLRIGVLAAGLVALHLTVVRPLWNRAGAANARKAARLHDCETVESGWSSLTDRVARATRATPVADSTVATWVATRANAGSERLPSTAAATPLLLDEIGRIAADYDVTWPVVEAGRPEATSVILSTGETVPVNRVRLTLAGRGTFAAVARAVGDLERSSLPLAVRDLTLKASPGGLIEAELAVDLFGAP